jgi:hypothetical protein
LILACPTGKRALSGWWQAPADAQILGNHPYAAAGEFLGQSWEITA